MQEQSPREGKRISRGIHSGFSMRCTTNGEEERRSREGGRDRQAVRQTKRRKVGKSEKETEAGVDTENKTQRGRQRIAERDGKEEERALSHSVWVPAFSPPPPRADSA